MSRRKVKPPRYVAVYFGLLDDSDFIKLPYSAQMLYIHMRRKFNPLKVDNPLQFELPHAELSKKMNSRTFTRAVKKLTEAGLIKIICPGMSYGSMKRKAVYEFTGDWRHYYVKGEKIQ